MIYAIAFYWLITGHATYNQINDGKDRFLTALAGFGIGWLVVPSRLLQKVIQ
jgi:hypothetical protein